MNEFRVYDERDKRYPGNQIDFCIMSDGRLCHFNIERESLVMYRTASEVPVNRYTVERSTDAFEYDENRNKGKLFYQGDIVRCDCFESHEIYIVEISDFRKLPDEMTGSKCNSRKIVGNIHDEVNNV